MNDTNRTQKRKLRPRDLGSMPAQTDADLSALVERMIPLVTAGVLSEFARLFAKASSSSVLTTRAGYGPDGIPDREWKRIAKEIGRKPYPGARWLVVDRAAYEAWLLAQSPAPVVKTAPAANDSEPWSPAKALAKAGLRATR